MAGWSETRPCFGPQIRSAAACRLERLFVLEFSKQVFADPRLMLRS
jgi:hypothetical protein